MGRRLGHELEQLPHHIYLHFDRRETVIYVGRTSDPERRPTDAKRRPWVKTESRRVEVSPPMPYDTAHWLEVALIRALNPKHNTNGGRLKREGEDPRIRQIMDAEGCPKATAKWALPYWISAADQFDGTWDEFVAYRHEAREAREAAS